MEAQPAWVQDGLRKLCTALRSSNVKVQWNACYAAGAVLRSVRAASVAAACGLIDEILLCLLHAMQDNGNFKACLCVCLLYTRSQGISGLRCQVLPVNRDKNAVCRPVGFL